MAGLANLEYAFVDTIADALFSVGHVGYEEGTVANADLMPGAPPIRLYRGWPISNEIESDLQSQTPVSHVSIYAAPERAKDLTMYMQQMQTTIVSQAPITLTVTVPAHSNTVTFGGTGSSSQVIGLSTRPDTAQSAGYAMRLTNNTTPQQVAQAFFSNLPNGQCAINGTTLTFSVPFRCDTGGDATQLTEVGRQDQVVQIDVWTPTYNLRDQIADFIDPALRFVRSFQFPDGSVSWPVLSAGTTTDDQTSKAYTWRRILFYRVTYATYAQTILPVMVLGNLNVQDLTFID